MTMTDQELQMPGRQVKHIEGPFFDEPWQARAFALVVNMSKAGLFPWADWSQALGAEIKRAPQRPDENINDAYFRQWMTALEGMVESLGLTSDEEISDRAEEWKQAYLNTPHGVPISLCNAKKAPEHVHVEAKREPIKVVPARV